MKILKPSKKLNEIKIALIPEDEPTEELQEIELGKKERDRDLRPMIHSNRKGIFGQ